MATSAITVLPGHVTDTPPHMAAGKRCLFCGTSPVYFGFKQNGGKWENSCNACAMSYHTQMIRLMGRLDQAEGTPVEQVVTDSLTPQVVAQLDAGFAAPEGSIAKRNAVTLLLALVQLIDNAVAKPAAAPRPNKYGGKCADCGGRVEAGEGTLTGQPGAWATHHLPGACPVVVAPVAPVVAAGPLAATEATRPGMTNGRKGKCIACGVMVDAGKGLALHGLPDHRGWSVLHLECADSLAADRAGLPGLLRQLGDRIIATTGKDTVDHAVRLAVDFVTGAGNGDQPLIFLRACWGIESGGVQVHTGAPGDVHKWAVGARRGVAIVTNLLALSDEALSKAQVDYGRKMQACGRCGSPLTDVVSRRIGLGPDCASKMM